MEKKQYVRIGLAVFIVFVIIWLHYTGVRDFLTFDQLKLHSAELGALVKAHYPQAVISFILLFILSVAVSLPAAFLFTLAGGFLFGTLLGTLYSVIGATLGSLLAFWIVRYVVGDFIQSRFASSLASFNRSVRQRGWLFLILVHYIAFVPFFLINILAGMTTVSSWTFFWTTIIGLTPVAFLYAFIGSKLQEISNLQDVFLSLQFIVALLLIALLGVIPLLLSYRKMPWQKWSKKH